MTGVQTCALPILADRVLGRATPFSSEKYSDFESTLDSSEFENMLHRYNLDSRLTASQQKNLSNLLLLANRRKERAQVKGTTCSVKCPKCQLSFLSEVSLKHHLSQERLQAICNQACELRETLVTLDSQTNSSLNNTAEKETNSEWTHDLLFSHTPESSIDTVSEADFQIAIDLFQNDSFGTSLEL